MIARRTVAALGLSQLLGWGISYYPIGDFGPQMTADLGWSRAVVYGGFSAALGVMGLSSSVIGRLIDRHGGRAIMATGSLLMAVACAGLAWATDLVSYYAAWAVLGLAMRCTLYDAAFATLVQLGGPQLRRAMSTITLPGGLASTVFWPIGHQLADVVGWRGAELVYAGIALATVPLHLALPRGAAPVEPGAGEASPGRASSPRDRRIAIALCLVISALTASLNTGLSAHMIGILSGLGIAATLAVTIASLRGVGQLLARLAELVLGARVRPLDLHLLAAAVLVLGFVGALAGRGPATMAAFAFLYGASNGILTITRGTVPLALFGHRGYGSLVGKMLVPGYVLSAIAPMIFAAVIDEVSPAAALAMSTVAAVAILVAAIALRVRFAAT
jgi:hypothetical protein